MIQTGDSSTASFDRMYGIPTKIPNSYKILEKERRIESGEIPGLAKVRGRREEEGAKDEGERGLTRVKGPNLDWIHFVGVVGGGEREVGNPEP